MNYLIIGGFKNSLNNNIEQFIRNYVANPKVLYISLASNKYSYSYQEFVRKIGIDIDLLTIEDLKNNNYIDKFYNSNILFFAGGNTKQLLNYIGEYNLDKYFFLNNIKLIAGVSAGGIMISSYGMGDADSFYDNGSYYNFKMIKGLGLLDICFCPHYNKEDLVLFDDECKKYNLDSYCLEDETAIYFENDKLSKVIKNERSNSVYYLGKGVYILTPIY